MLRPSGEICGSDTDCKSNTSMGLRGDSTASAALGTAAAAVKTTAKPNDDGAHNALLQSIKHYGPFW